MRIVVVIPNDQWRNAAGVRIRYERIRPFLEASGHSLRLVTIDDSELAHGPKPPQGDVYLFSKCHDTRALVLAHRLRAMGRKVGIDIFDDYYSQHSDGEFVHLRRWFQDMAATVDFLTCSTPNMRSRLKALAPTKPLLVMNDPAGEWDSADLASTLAAKLDRTLETRQLDIGWFGIGDHPYFSVGIDDLSAFSGTFLKIRAQGFEPRLRILTNERALTPERLELIARLPVSTTLELWSEAREQALIADSLFCFLPVNCQAFSTVKSLNRAVSILTSGAQVLSAGYPLYDSLAPFIYRDISELLDHLRSRSLRVRPETLPDLSNLMEQFGSAENEANRLAGFLGGLPAPGSSAWPPKNPLVVLHGHGSNALIHKVAQKNRVLSAAGPYTTEKLNYDITPTVDPEGAWIDISLSPRALGYVRDALKDHVDDRAEEIPSKKNPDEKPKIRHHLRLTRSDLPSLGFARPKAIPPRFIEDLARYRFDMKLMREVYDVLFEDPEILLSETTSPFYAPELSHKTPETAHAE